MPATLWASVRTATRRDGCSASGGRSRRRCTRPRRAAPLRASVDGCRKASGSGVHPLDASGPAGCAAPPILRVPARVPGIDRKCDKTGPSGLTAHLVASYGARALIGERPGTGSRQGTLAETPRSRTSREVGSSGTLRLGHFFFGFWGPPSSAAGRSRQPPRLIPTLTGLSAPFSRPRASLTHSGATSGAHGE